MDSDWREWPPFNEGTYSVYKNPLNKVQVITNAVCTAVGKKIGNPYLEMRQCPVLVIMQLLKANNYPEG